MEPSCIFSITSERRCSITSTRPVAPSNCNPQKWSSKVNLTTPLSFLTSIRSMVLDVLIEIESFIVCAAIAYKLSNGSHCLKLEVVPWWVFSKIRLPLCFFQPKRIPETDIKKKKTNSNAPVMRWIFLKVRNILACFCRLFWVT